jgi:hypothetical protein
MLQNKSGKWLKSHKCNLLTFKCLQF